MRQQPEPVTLSAARHALSGAEGGLAEVTEVRSLRALREMLRPPMEDSA